METIRLSTKGQIVLPLNIRTSHAWEPGTEFTVEETAEGILLRPVGRFKETNIDMVAGILKSRRKAVTLTTMETAVEREIARRHDSGRY